MLWLAAALESLDDDHATAAAGAWPRQHAGFVDPGFGRVEFVWLRWHGEQLAGARNIDGTVAIGKQTVVADAVEAGAPR